MELLKQCQKWNEDNEFKKIVDALENIPKEERTPEIDSELARAYNNLADPEDRAMFKKAIALLSPHEEYFAGDHLWNFRMGYSYYFLDQEGLALQYFEKALEARPDDEDTKWFIDNCQKAISMPQFKENFRERTVNAWEVFLEREAELRLIIDEDKDHMRGEELVDKCSEILNLAFDDISFEMGFNGEKYELILTPEGNKVKLFELVYFQNHAPAEIFEKWNILVGRQAIKNIGLRSDNWEVSGDDVQVWAEKLDENSVGLTLYCEKLLPLIKEDENRAWWMLSTITDQVLGEISAIRYINSFDVVKEPKDEPAILLSNLPNAMEEMGMVLSSDPQKYLESYSGYQMEPNEDPEADWRLDVIVGSTCCPAIINNYLNGENYNMDMLHADGAVAGFLCYPLDGFSGENGSEEMFNFRDALEQTLIENAGDDAVTLIGGATGIYCGYVDFIAWDLNAVLETARKFFLESDLAWANFHTFRREAGTIRLINREEKEPKDDENQEQEENQDREETDTESKGAFAGFVLLSEPYWDKEQLINDLKENWNITAKEDDDEDKREDSLVFEVGNMIAAVSLMEAPIPNGEAEVNAENNYMWPEAVEVAKAHKAHIMVAVLGKDEDLLERGKLYTKIVASCSRQENATGVYTSGVVFQPRFYEGFADMMKNDELPIFNWIWFGLYRTEKGVSGYTYGMDIFGKDEIEVLDADADPSDLRDFMAGIVSYVLEYDAKLCDGETIGFTAEDKHTITLSEGVALHKMTLKISYEPTEEKADDNENCLEMDDGECHLESLQEKNLPVDEINAYNHMAIYLRFCIENDLMSDEFIENYGQVAESVKENPDNIDLREFIKNELDGRLFSSMFDEQGEAFACYYYGYNDHPYYPADIDDYALKYFGSEKYYSDQFDDEAYLFVPFDENYYEAMAKVIGKRFANWQGQEFADDTEPSELAEAMVDYLDCECEYFPPMKDDDPITSALSYAKREGVKEGFIPVLVKVDDILWECLIINSDPESDGEEFDFNREQVENYRKAILSMPIKDGKTILADLIGVRQEEAEEDDIDFEKEVVGTMEGGYNNYRFSSYWDYDTNMTYPLILAKIPVKNPWEVFAYLPFGNWNECPDTKELMAVSKYWFKKYGAVPAAFTHDELEFMVKSPISKENAMELAIEQYGFCPDMDQNFDHIGALADTLWQSDKWYFWWD